MEDYEMGAYEMHNKKKHIVFLRWQKNKTKHKRLLKRINLIFSALYSLLHDNLCMYQLDMAILNNYMKLFESSCTLTYMSVVIAIFSQPLL